MDTKRVQPDRSKINLDQSDELKYWTRALKVSEEEIRAAIEKVGNSAATVPQRVRHHGQRELRQRRRRMRAIAIQPQIDHADHEGRRPSEESSG